MLPTKELKIASGQTTSPALETGGASLAAILLPAALTGTTLSFLISFDGGVNFFPLYRSSGTLYTIPFVASVVLSGLDPLMSVADHIKLKSNGTEAAERTFKVIYR